MDDGTAAGSMPWVRGGISESFGGGIDGLQMVTPIFIQTSLPALEIVYGSYVRIALQLELCNDGVDNDGDGVTDYPNDPECSAPTDSTEGPPGACENGVDDDGDGEIDLADPGCIGPLDSSETSGAICDNGLDDDGDGLVDLADPGCELSAVLFDPSERGVDIDCDNDYDDDGDGQIDYPADSGCASPDDSSELVEACSNGLDDDGDGLVDLADPGCFGPSDPNERGASGYMECDDGIDNDGDGKSDFPADPGCFAAYDFDEGIPSAATASTTMVTASRTTPPIRAAPGPTTSTSTVRRRATME